MNLSTIILLITSGLFVGIINTFAGGAAVISIAVYTAIGMPVGVANGTNRVPVLFQCFTSSMGFIRKGLLDFRTGLKLGVPTTAGAVAGAQLAVMADDRIMTILLSGVLLLLLIVMIFNPSKMFKPADGVSRRAIRPLDYLWFFLIGIYGGCFHIGVGYLILAVSIMGMGYNIMEANALKGFIVMVYIPFSFTVFLLNGQVEILYGLVHAAGNVIGAYIAVKYSDYISNRLLRWSLIILTIIILADLVGVIDLSHLLRNLLA